MVPIVLRVLVQRPNSSVSNMSGLATQLSMLIKETNSGEGQRKEIY
jgi:hypothetical protein